MTAWTPDPGFYPSPRMAMKAPQETLAYVAAFDPDRKTPDAIAVVDVDPKSKTYSRIIGTTTMPNAGDELHHFGWNACSSCPWPNAPHAQVSEDMPITRRTAARRSSPYCSGAGPGQWRQLGEASRPTPRASGYCSRCSKFGVIRSDAMLVKPARH